MAKVTFLLGLCGSGKTHLAKGLERETGAKFIEGVLAGNRCAEIIRSVREARIVSLRRSGFVFHTRYRGAARRRRASDHHPSHGLGEVYRAKDTRLDRTVAVKILPAHLSDNPEAKQRFEREARTISSLNHPNICTLHDVGHQDGTDFLVMEYLEGETLAARLKKGPLSPDQVLRCGIEICEGLEKAHKSGVIHRDRRS